jgi:hypothetical protein
MDRYSNVYSTASGVPATPPAGVQARLTDDPPASGEGVPAGRCAVDAAELILRLIEDHDRIAQGVNGVVIRRLFAAGLELESAVELIGEHRATPKVCHAISELDQAIRDLRDAIFGLNRGLGLTDSRGP